MTHEMHDWFRSATVLSLSVVAVVVVTLALAEIGSVSISGSIIIDQTSQPP